DHPDSQREKMARAARLTKFAADIRFVPVDFTRDNLDESLASAGHDPARGTTWIWEGVVMYLTQDAIEATLAVIERRSAVRSRLIVLYHTPAIMRRFVGLIVRRLGEPFRSHSTAEEMRVLLAKYGFNVTGDKDMHEIGLTMSAEIAHAMRAVKHMRIAIADRE
ncbi:MAG: class I SAM-dependent methyltransferase, partial [Blastocatellia bacterium]|nr:class I SAM-dependent methyltransferase [Blastocatellia bacterium]